MSATRDRSPKTRARRLAKHPLCAECLNAGVTKATEEIDHIIPLEWMGKAIDGKLRARLVGYKLIKPFDMREVIDFDLDVDANVQGMCTYHNRMKRNAESYGHVVYGLDGWPVEEGT